MVLPRFVPRCCWPQCAVSSCCLLFAEAGPGLPACIVAGRVVGGLLFVGCWCVRVFVGVRRCALVLFVCSKSPHGVSALICYSPVLRGTLLRCALVCLVAHCCFVMWFSVCGAVAVVVAFVVVADVVVVVVVVVVVGAVAAVVVGCFCL